MELAGDRGGTAGEEGREAGGSRDLMREERWAVGQAGCLGAQV